MQGKISTLTGVIIIIIFSVLMFGGVFAYKYFFIQPITENVVVNTVKSEAKNIDSFVPVGWKVLGTEEGDLNKDGLDDAVMVTEDVNYKTVAGTLCDQFSCPRRLLILFQTKNKGYELSTESDKAILLAGEGGIFGDPFAGIEIENGSFLINFYGGSAWRWSNSYRFRYQDSAWFLIGATSFNYFNVVDCVDDKVDYNFLTGRKQEIKSNKWDIYLQSSDGEEDKSCSREEVWSDINNNRLINLNKFVASGFDLSQY